MIKLRFRASSGKEEKSIDFTVRRNTQALMPNATPTPKDYEAALGDLMSSYGMAAISRSTVGRK